ncbi:MAG: hypothetical protein Q8L66_06790 [Caulobacter sp.]|nr:hypothetical protein [Caulobacter sp.]
MTPVRPSHLPSVQPPATGTANARTAAQRAFFEQALGRTAEATTTAPVRAAPASAPTIHVTPVQTTSTDGKDQPTKIPRPGSLLDIRV